MSRYRFGGIAYHHISDTYIALFSHFIACGVGSRLYPGWLLKNLSALRPDMLYADTHGQAEPVFGLAALFGNYAYATDADLERCHLLSGGPRTTYTTSTPCLPKWSTGT